MKSFKYYPVAVALFLTALSCGINDQQAGSGSQTTNGNCIGMIYNKDKTVASGVTVRLVPSGYDPGLPSTGAIDSTVTDRGGSYNFTVAKTDFYNVIAEQGEMSCLQDSVPLLTDKVNRIANDTLDGSGWLAGTIRVKPGNDPKLAILLVPGTNRYTSPIDSLGSFPALQLPAGRYPVRIFTSDPGYAVFDTMVVIFPEDTTFIGSRIPTSYAPAVNNFRVIFDTASLTATLVWDPVDTSLLKSYVLHRSVDNVEDTGTFFNKRMSGYVDECIPFFGKTLVYELSALGTSYKEGYKATSAPILVCGKLKSITKTPLGNFSLETNGFWKICVDADRNIYFHNYEELFKVASDGTLLKRIDVKTIAGPNTVAVWSMQSDRHNNLYIYVQGIRNSDRCHSVYKLDSDFKIIDSLSIPDSCVCVSEHLSATAGSLDIIFIGDDGTVYVHASCNDTPAPATIIRVYGADLKFQNSFIVPGATYIKQRFNDTIMAIQLINPNVDDRDQSVIRQICMLYDQTFNLLSSFESKDQPGSTVYESALNVWPLSGNNYMTINYDYVFRGGSAVVMTIADRQGNPVGKQVFPADFCFQFTSSSEIVGFSNTGGPVIYRISLNSLLKK